MSNTKFSHETNESVTPDVEADTSAQPADEACEAVPVATHIVARAVYKTCYVISYGVVFGSLLIAKLIIPKNSVVDNGLRDGAVAAREAIDKEVEILADESEVFAEIHEEDTPVPA
ncbi:MAG: hypothetical protein PHE55_00180 [Methylococcaceae bacterium]|nr:hypothetical protein [Methylococcaceae bacterium]